MGELTTLDVPWGKLRTGDSFRTPPRRLTQATIDAFAELCGDTNPIHVDPEAAAAGPFGRPVAHGLLTLALTGGLRHPLAGPHMLAIAGLDRVRFVAPVFPEDELHVEGEVLELRERDERTGLVLFREQVVNQAGETVAAYERRALYAR